MKPIRLIYSGPKLRPGQLESLEAQFGQPLPDDYRAFMLQHNGGTPNRRFFKYKASAEYPNYVSRFCFLDKHLADPSPDAPSGSLSSMLFLHRNENLHRDCIPIGEDDTGDPILLGLKGRRRGKVSLQIIIEGADLIELEPGPDVFPLAKSFSEFLDGLKATEEELM